jgi:hypothetical protein
MSHAASIGPGGLLSAAAILSMKECRNAPLE